MYNSNGCVPHVLMVYQTLFKVALCHITFEYFENLCEGICLYGATGRRCETNDFIVINYVVISYMHSPWI